MANNIVQAGNIVRTSYGSGPYVIKQISGPCVCARYDRIVSGSDISSERHFHAICKGIIGHEKGGTYYLNGLREDGTSVWSDDFLTVVKLADQISFSF